MTRRDVRVLVAVFLGLTVVLTLLRAALTGTDVPDERDLVVVTARVAADGEATVTVAPGSGEREDVREYARRIAETLLGHEVARVRIHEDGGKPYAVATLRAFAPGDAPVVRVDGGRASTVARAAGRWRMVLRLEVPSTGSLSARWTPSPYGSYSHSEWSWEPDAAQVVAGTLTLRPSPSRGWLGLGLLLGGATAAFLGISLWPRRRARGRTLCGVVALACAVSVVPLHAWPYPELGVAGVADGVFLAVLRQAFWAWLTAMVLGPWLLLTPRRRATIPA